jgi:hypothetical protein
MWDPDGHRDHVHVRSGNQFLVIGEHRIDTERSAGGARRRRAVGAQRSDLIVRQCTQCWHVGSGGPATVGTDADGPHTQR